MTLEFAMPSSNSGRQGAPVLRFAPSPTGFLHIGGARTALFNWLYAKANKGRFLLRIEDTDRERNNPEAVAAILDGLKWLGLDWDGEPVSQFARGDRHREVAESMLQTGAAYRCYLTPDDLAGLRQQAEQDKKPLRIHSPWRDKSPEEAPEGQPYSVRLKLPGDGETIIHDRVQGDITFANKDLDDFIILRSDGSPTYHLAVVVDDHDMGVTHVVRGVDHLSNAARQSHIFTAMNWDQPVWAHVPLIHGADGAKLSKRHGALGVEAYRDMGYLPVALRNYLVRLGWSHGDDEIMSTEQLIDWFDIDDIGKSPARFDTKKLEDLNAHYIRDSNDDDLLAAVRIMLASLDGGSEFTTALDNLENGWLRFKAALPGLKPRAKTLLELVEGAKFLTDQRPLSLDAKAAKVLDDSAREVLAGLHVELQAASPWDEATVEAIVRAYAEKCDLKLGKVAQPLRAALTGRAVSPPIFDVMALLGKPECLARLADQAIEKT
jgi:glutamyl-tRNA synthetase